MTVADLTIANTILAQLGGQRFKLMTGARLVGSDRSLIIKMPKTGKDGSNKWVITLNGRDTYDIDTSFVRGMQSFPKSHFTDIYVDSLVELFERTSGFYTKL